PGRRAASPVSAAAGRRRRVRGGGGWRAGERARRGRGGGAGAGLGGARPAGALRRRRLRRGRLGRRGAPSGAHRATVGRSGTARLPPGGGAVLGARGGGHRAGSRGVAARRGRGRARLTEARAPPATDPWPTTAHMARMAAGTPHYHSPVLVRRCPAMNEAL